MKTLASGLTVALLASFAVAAQQSSEPARAIVASYLEIQAHLAADRVEGVNAAAKALTKQAAAIGKAGADIGKAASALEAAGALDAARDAFGPLSDAVIALVQTDGFREAAADLRLAYCPMAKRSWLQREDRLRNPYYGSAMLSCGEFKPLK